MTKPMWSATISSAASTLTGRPSAELDAESHSHQRSSVGVFWDTLSCPEDLSVLSLEPQLTVLMNL